MTRGRLKRAAFIAFILLLEAAARASTPLFLSSGHREAMMANGGSTDFCSPGQFALNPAGVFCETKKDRSESFGSTSFSALGISTTQGNLNDLGEGFRTSPGLSLFSQGNHDGNRNIGFWGAINQTNVVRLFAFTMPQLDGSFDVSSAESDTGFGGFMTGRWGDTYWGATVGINQSEQKVHNFSKFLLSGNTFVTNQSGTSIEYLLTSRIGFIKPEEVWSYSLVLALPSLSLRGETRTDSTTISTSNSFSETLQRGSTRTRESGTIMIGAQKKLDPWKKFGFDASLTGATQVDTEGNSTSLTSATPSVASLGGSLEWIFTEKITALSGLRYYNTFNVSDNRGKTEGQLLSFGILRTYKGVELGSGVGYNRYVVTSPANTSSTSETKTIVNKIDVTFSSSFTY